MVLVFTGDPQLRLLKLLPWLVGKAAFYKKTIFSLNVKYSIRYSHNSYKKLLIWLNLTIQITENQSNILNCLAAFLHPDVAMGN